MSGGLYMKQRGTLHRLMMVCLFLLLCMQGAAAQELMLPQALLKIEQQAFIGNDAFEYIVLPDGLETIAEKAFADCSGLRRQQQILLLNRRKPDAQFDS